MIVRVFVRVIHVVEVEWIEDEGEVGAGETGVDTGLDWGEEDFLVDCAGDAVGGGLGDC